MSLLKYAVCVCVCVLSYCWSHCFVKWVIPKHTIFLFSSYYYSSSRKDCIYHHKSSKSLDINLRSQVNQCLLQFVFHSPNKEIICKYYIKYNNIILKKPDSPKRYGTMKYIFILQSGSIRVLPMWFLIFSLGIKVERNSLIW